MHELSLFCVWCESSDQFNAQIPRCGSDRGNLLAQPQGHQSPEPFLLGTQYVSNWSITAG